VSLHTGFSKDSKFAVSRKEQLFNSPIVVQPISSEQVISLKIDFSC
jgi:hypothetical protein